MFTYFKNRLRNLLENSEKDFNETLESFGDPLAKEIEWSSIARCGFFYKTRKLSKNGTGDIIFYPTLISIIFPSLFMAMGGYIVYRAVLYKIPVINLIYHPINSLLFLFHQIIQSGFSGMLLGFLFGLVFFMVGAVTLIFAIRPVIFNVKERIYYKGFSHKNCINFSNIHAIQLLSDPGNGPESQTNYELNLVLKSKERVNVFSHAKSKDILNDAEQLSQLLSVPVWNMM